MTLLEEFVTQHDEDEYVTADETAHEVGAKLVHSDTLQRTRWGTVEEEVYQRGDEYVKVTYEAGSGDSEVPYDPEFEEVKPVEKTVITYVKV